MTYQASENGKLYSLTLVLEKIDDKNTRVTISYNNIKLKRLHQSETITKGWENW